MANRFQFQRFSSVKPKCSCGWTDVRRRNGLWGVRLCVFAFVVLICEVVECMCIVCVKEGEVKRQHLEKEVAAEVDDARVQDNGREEPVGRM